MTAQIYVQISVVSGGVTPSQLLTIHIMLSNFLSFVMQASFFHLRHLILNPFLIHTCMLCSLRPFSCGIYSQSFLFDSLACIAVFSLSPAASHSQSFPLIHLHALQSLSFSCDISFSILSLWFNYMLCSLFSFSCGVPFSILSLWFTCVHWSRLSFPLASHSQSFHYDSLACFAVLSLFCGVLFSIFALLQTRFLLNMPSLSFSVAFFSRLFLSLTLCFSNHCSFRSALSKAYFNFSHMMENKQLAMAVSSNLRIWHIQG